MSFQITLPPSPHYYTFALCAVLFYSSYGFFSKKIGLPPISVVGRVLSPVVKFVLVPLYVISRWFRSTCSSSSDDEHGILYEIEKQAQHWLSFVSVPSLVVNDVLGICLLYFVSRHFHPSYISSRAALKERVAAFTEFCFEYGKEFIPLVRRELAKERKKMELQFSNELKDPKRTITKVLPKEGRAHDAIYKEMKEKAQAEDKLWLNGRVSGGVYSGEAEHIALLNSAYSLYSIANPLHPDIWPSLSQYEGEVCAMTADMLHGDADETCGFVSSGGSESIFLAVKAHQAFYRYTRRFPEMIACTTAHAAVQKACAVLGIRLIQLSPDPVTFTLRPGDVERHVSSQTILIYASAPSFPQGTIDPIEPLGHIAQRHATGLHVDACLGGFILPFARKLGYDHVPKFDFAVPGVTSMSCDTHKYGYATKGTSVVLYRNKELRRAQYFCYPNWTGGLYVTPAMAGSRPGGLVVCAWASLIAMGESGYLARTKQIMETTHYIAKRLPDGIHLLGSVLSHDDGKNIGNATTTSFSIPQAMVICIASHTLNIYEVADAMKKKSEWNLNSLQNPSCVHLCVTVQTNGLDFVSDLEDVVRDLMLKKKNGEPNTSGGTAAVYGMAGSLPDGPVNELLKCYVDVSLSP